MDDRRIALVPPRYGPDVVGGAELVLREVGCWVGLPEAEDVDDCPLDVVVRRRVMATAQPDLIDKMRRALGEAAAVSW